MKKYIIALGVVYVLFIMACSNVLIENCIFNIDDDVIAIEAGRNQDG